MFSFIHIYIITIFFIPDKYVLFHSVLESNKKVKTPTKDIYLL